MAPRRFSLAGQLLYWGLLGVCLTMTSCLFPQDDQLIDEVPAARNRPPRFIEEQFSPQEVKTQAGSFGTNCLPLSFSAVMEDPDNDRLLARWFWDGVFLHDHPVTLKATTTSPPTGTDSFSADVTGKPGLHWVELLIMDGQIPAPGRTGPEPIPRALPDGGTYLDPTYVVSHAWFVNVTNDPCQTAPGP